MMTRKLLRAGLLYFALAGCKEKPPSAEAEKPEGTAHAELITLSAEAVRGAQIEVGAAKVKELTERVTIPARIVFPQDGVARVSARVPGRLTSIDVQLGQAVPAGAVLGRIESPDLAQARAEYLSAATKAGVAAGNFEREKTLLDKGITSERETREAESVFVTAQADRNAAEARLHTLGLSDSEIASLKREAHYSSRFPLRTPIAGTVVEVLASPGQAVDGTTTLFTVGNLSRLWALLDAPESQVTRLGVGQTVELTVTGHPDRRFTGRVDYVGDIVEENTRAVHVRVVLENEDRTLKPGMFANALVATSSASDGGMGTPSQVVVPRESVQSVGSQQVVFIPRGTNQFAPVAVQVGATTATEAVILNGLEPGAAVVTRGAFILKSELSKESMGEGDSH